MHQSLLKKESAVLNRICGSRKELVGTCRFINNPQVKLDQLMQTNIESCKAHVMESSHYLSIQDTSDIICSSHSGKLRILDPDIGPLGRNDKKGTGFLLHPSLVVDRSNGFPVGFSDIKIWNRQFGQKTKKERNYQSLSIEEKESYKWIEGIEKSSWLKDKCANVTHVMDSEGDIYDVLCHPLACNEDLLVRSCYDRYLFDHPGGTKLSDYLSSLPISCSFKIDIKATKKRKAREGKFGLKYATVKIKRSKNNSVELPEYIEVNVVQVTEYPESVPAGEDPIEWVLYTTHAVENIEQAFQIVQWYTMRWIIEMLFSSLKTRGLDIESSQLETGIGLKKLTTICLQVSLQLLQLTKDRDNKCNQKASLIFTPEALGFLEALILTLEGKTQKQKNQFEPGSLAWAAWGVARLGGWKGYKSESPPGVRTFNRGLIKFWDAFEGWTIANNCGST